MNPRQQVRQYIEDNLIIFDRQVTFTDTDNIFERGFVNSLFAMKLLTHLEHTFSITFDDQDLEIHYFSSVDNIVKLIERKQSQTYA